MGRAGMREALSAGANDLGGTLMNESITRAAGATHGQEMTPSDMLLARGLARALAPCSARRSIAARRTALRGIASRRISRRRTSLMPSRYFDNERC